MKELIIKKECVVNGSYEEPVYDHAPWFTYTSKVAHKLHVGDRCYIDDEGEMLHESDEYGVSLHPGILRLYPSDEEKGAVFGRLTEDMKKPWFRMTKEKSEIKENLDDLRLDLYHLQMELDYHLDREMDGNASTDRAWEVLIKKTKAEHELAYLELRYAGICISMQLLANTLPRYQ